MYIHIYIYIDPIPVDAFIKMQMYCREKGKSIIESLSCRKMKARIGCRLRCGMHIHLYKYVHMYFHIFENFLFLMYVYVDVGSHDTMLAPYLKYAFG
jgi:hypothetical protein